MLKATEIAAEMVALAESHDSAEHLAFAATLLAQSQDVFQATTSRPPKATTGHGRLWESIGKPALRGGLMFSQGHYRMQSAYNLWFLGYPDHAVERAGIATALTQKSASKHMLSEVHYWAAALYELRREPDHVRAAGRSSAGSSERGGQSCYPLPKRM